MKIFRKLVASRLARIFLFGALSLTAAFVLGSNQYFSSRAASGKTWYVVQPGSVSKPLFLSGILVSKKTQPVASAYKTRLTEISVVSGQHVLAGDKLVSFDSRAIELELLEARAKLAEAQQQLDEVQDWQSSTAVVTATRELESAERRERVLAQKVGNAKSLHRKGIISRDELDEGTAELSDQRSETQSRREALNDVLSAGRGARLQFAELKLKTASQVVELLEQELSETRVTASFDGIVYQEAVTDFADAIDNLHPGDAVEADKNLFFVANTRELLVKASVNELDINFIREGMDVSVSSDAIPGITFDGIISHLSARAVRVSGDAVPTFDVYVDLEKLTQAEAEIVRLNVSVTVAAEVYRNDSSLLVPEQSLEMVDGNAVVTVSDADGDERMQRVETGVVTEHFVEIVSGLRAGDRVAVDVESLAQLQGLLKSNADFMTDAPPALSVECDSGFHETLAGYGC